MAKNNNRRKVVGEFVKRNRGKAKIKEITEERILFTNGAEITFDHDQDCCEWNYADFNQLDDIARKETFSFPLSFEAVDGAGFRFGNQPYKMYFIPCYSEQNGYYTDKIDIYLNGRKIISGLTCDDRDII